MDQAYKMAQKAFLYTADPLSQQGEPTG
jgi:hypothetical protein